MSTVNVMTLRVYLNTKHAPNVCLFYIYIWEESPQKHIGAIHRYYLNECCCAWWKFALHHGKKACYNELAVHIDRRCLCWGYTDEWHLPIYHTIFLRSTRHRDPNGPLDVQCTWVNTTNLYNISMCHVCWQLYTGNAENTILFTALVRNSSRRIATIVYFIHPLLVSFRTTWRTHR